MSVAACTSTQQVAASKEKLNQSARAIIGTSLIGAIGESPKDKEAIGETVAGICGAKVWTVGECARHDELTRIAQ